MTEIGRPAEQGMDPRNAAGRRHAMRRLRIRRQRARAAAQDMPDLRTPSGRTLPY
ncbi:hypothetical protein [Sphaerisporangium album]|uniref:hypothetical protein n=1 Tax=Sphaerisporangium album TaxID=509200 RepID=UPI0015F11E30|nr:hypothetical protein [Sphaerisporangium album]